MPTIEERLDTLHRRQELFVDALDEMDERLRRIANQNAKLAEMVEVLGGYINQAIDHVQNHEH